MSLLAEAVNPRPRAAAWPVTDDRWYVRDLSGYIADAGSGVALSAESILRCGTVLAALRFLGDSLAMCPPSTYRKTARGRDEDPTHASQIVLRNPNKWMTGNRWRHLMAVWLRTWGNAYSRIIPGPRSFLGELRPLHPSTMRIKEQRADGSLLYEYTPRAGLQREYLGGEEVLHFRDLGTDGLQGVAMYALIRNVVGIALLAEQHASTFLRKGTRVSGLLVPAAPLNAEQRKDLRESVNADFGGASQTGSLGILPHGVEIKPIGITNRDAQFLELSDQVVGNILRFMGVPGVVVGYADKTATYASAKEFFESGGIKHCVLPILTNVEAEEEKSLLAHGDDRFIRHNLDVLLRASLADRYKAFSQALGGAPFLSVNDVREQDDWNPDPDARHDEIRIPANLTPPAAPGLEPEADEPARREPVPRDDGGQTDDAARVLPFPVAAGHVSLPAQESAQCSLCQRGEPCATDEALAQVAKLYQYAQDNVARVQRRERDVLHAKATKLAKNPAGWRAFVRETYERHAPYVSETLRVTPEAAREYCERQSAALLAGGMVAFEGLEPESASRLLALALGETA